MTPISSVSPESLSSNRRTCLEVAWAALRQNSARLSRIRRPHKNSGEWRACKNGRTEPAETLKAVTSGWWRALGIRIQDGAARIPRRGKVPAGVASREFQLKKAKRRQACLPCLPQAGGRQDAALHRWQRKSRSLARRSAVGMTIGRGFAAPLQRHETGSSRGRSAPAGKRYEIGRCSRMTTAPGNRS